LGIDETSARSVRWVHSDGMVAVEPVADLLRRSPGVPGSLLGSTPDRSGACVKDWLEEQTKEFRNTITIVVIDPSAPYASAIRAAQPNSKIVGAAS
jgi:transposase